MPTDLPEAFTRRMIFLAKVASVLARSIDNPKVVQGFQAVCERMGILDPESDAIKPVAERQDDSSK